MAIVSYGAEGTGVARFVLTPLEAGALKRDSGTGSAVLSEERVVIREGQRVALHGSVLGTFKGRRGTVVIRSRIEYVDAGSGYHVGIGTWKVVRGTRRYARLTGGGDEATCIWTPGRGVAATRDSHAFVIPEPQAGCTRPPRGGPVNRALLAVRRIVALTTEATRSRF